MKRKHKKLLYMILAITSIFILYAISSSSNDNISTENKQIQLKMRQLVKIKDPYSEEFLLNPEYSICNPFDNNYKVLLIALVAIAPDSLNKRAMIRSTWGSKFFQEARLIFLLAKSTDENVNSAVADEYNQFKDIVLLNYIDSYENLTTKIMMGFNWIAKYCPNSQYVLRVNDDVVVNTFGLINFLKNMKYEHNRIIGYRITGVAPVRNSSFKFYVSYKEYDKEMYDPYVEGSAYLITTDLAWVYYNKYLYFHYPPFSVWLEDVYIG